MSNYRKKEDFNLYFVVSKNRKYEEYLDLSETNAIIDRLIN